MLSSSANVRTSSEDNSSSTDTEKNFAIAYVNCEDMKNRDLMQEYNIHAFPTVYVIDKEGNHSRDAALECVAKEGH